MKISYAITVYNELNEIKKLISFLIEHKREADEIVVLMDSKGTQEVYDYLVSVRSELKALVMGKFENNFANWKNKLTGLCSGDYIFQIDADEIPSIYLIMNLPVILENNNADIILVPRVNTVKGITREHIQKWQWSVDERGWINFPDYQWRIYKNTLEILWTGKVHEKLTGYSTYASLPAIEEYCLYHEKDIDRQELQNSYYATLT